jgi:hypothetical protein
MSIVFAAIAAISFAVDQTMVSSLGTGELGTGDDLGRSLGAFSPVRLIQSLIETASDRVE